jgi:hypothetical protein
MPVDNNCWFMRSMYFLKYFVTEWRSRARAKIGRLCWPMQPTAYAELLAIILEFYLYASWYQLLIYEKYVYKKYFVTECRSCAWAEIGRWCRPNEPITYAKLSAIILEFYLYAGWHQLPIYKKCIKK